MSALCQMTGLSRAGFYRWRVPRQATPVEMELRDQMQKVALESPAYGYRRITHELQQRGFEVNHLHTPRRPIDREQPARSHVGRCHAIAVAPGIAARRAQPAPLRPTRDGAPCG